MTNILVTGANGQLGRELRDLEAAYKQFRFFFADKTQLDITNKEAIDTYCTDHAIEVIINAAAYTAVDKAESDQDNCFTINSKAAVHLAEIAKAKGIALVHISTDYVFDGKKTTPYVETDVTRPQTVYGKSKLEGEKAVQRIAPKNSVIIRTSWIFSSYGNNFVKTMLRLAKEKDTIPVVYDQLGCPTYAAHLAEAILQIIPQLSNETPEVYHFTNKGVSSWYGFANAIFEFANVEVTVKAIETPMYPTPAKRPLYSIMKIKAIEARYGLEIPKWRVGLQQCLEKLKTNS